MRRALITLIILAILGTAGVWTYQNFFAPAPEEFQEEREEQLVETGTLLLPDLPAELHLCFEIILIHS